MGNSNFMSEKGILLINVYQDLVQSHLLPFLSFPTNVKVLDFRKVFFFLVFFSFFFHITAKNFQLITVDITF